MISSDYTTILRELNGKENFGKRKSLPKYLDSIISKYNPTSILDFGCGTGSLVNTLSDMFPAKVIKGYDPGNENYNDNCSNQKFDLVISTDVLEHIEPEFLQQTLEFLKERSDKFYHLIALSPSRVILPDGRNAHLILQTKDWWKDQFVKQGYKVTFEKHMHHVKENRTVNKYFIAGQL